MFAAKNELFTTPSGYQIQRSVRTRGAYPTSPSYLSRTAGTPTNNLKWTFSFWAKRGVLGVGQNILNAGTGTSASEDYLVFLGTDKLAFDQGNGTTTVIATNAVFRDPSAWYHIVLVYDSAQATSTNRLFIYVNGVSQSFSSATYPTLNQATNINASSVLQRISSRTYLADEGFDGYLTEVNFIDGQALTPASFGEINPVTGVWAAKKYAGTYGTNGFYLNFSDNSAATAAAIGKDSSGNGNNWTPSGISVTAGVTYDSMLDVPLGAGGADRGNYCTINPNDKAPTLSISNGNLTQSTASTTYRYASRGSIWVSTGKWYWENTITSVTSGVIVGINGTALPMADSDQAFDTAPSYGYFGANGNKYVNGTSSAYGATYTTGDVIGIALDMDAGTITFYKNNTSQGTAATGIAGTFAACIAIWNATVNANFGQRPFAYTPPTGFKALHTGNLPDAVIKLPAQYMAATLYTGNSSTQTISNAINGVSMQPDFVWIKNRSIAAQHVLTDSVRGVDRQLFSSLTNAEQTSATAITALNSNGFTTGANPSPTGSTNSSPDAFVAWQWKAGGTAVSNTAGSITSSVSANTTAGFSVVTYTGTGANATVGHGLGVAPSMIITKGRDAVPNNWGTWHTSLGALGYLYLNNTAAVGSLSTFWNSAVPTSSVFSLGSETTVNTNTKLYVAYCFAAVAGYSAFGSYTGNGSTDGPFVYLGFRPRYLMIRDTGSADWDIQDTARSPYNTSKDRLWANLSSAEVSSTYDIDFLSNGFKIRSTNPDTNSSGGTKIYMAFAENPFKNSLAR